MKKTLIAATIAAGLTMASVANADDPEDHLLVRNKLGQSIIDVDREIARLEHQMLINQARKIFPDSTSYYVFTDRPLAVYIVGRSWKEVADGLADTKELKPYLSPINNGPIEKKRPVGKIDPTHEEVHEASIVGIDYDISATQQQIFLQKARRMFPEGTGMMTWNEKMKTIFIFGQNWEDMAKALKKCSSLREYLAPESASRR